MPWAIEYYEQADTTQPTEVFEDAVYGKGARKPLLSSRG
jgi:hypothetical protein